MPSSPILLALISALLFGVSAPLAKLLLADGDPWLVAGLLYLGSGVPLLGGWMLRHRRRPRWPGRDWLWLAAAVLAGGVAGPVLLMYGLALGSGSAAALLLTLEGVFTAILAWTLFGEHFHARIGWGMVAITAGAMLLAGLPGQWSWSAPLVAAACLCWAIDNNLTRMVSANDPVLIAGIKGCIAGSVNLALALSGGAAFPAAATTAGVLALGFAGYGVSLVMFILALRSLGSSRTAGYFATAPFLGAACAVPLLGEPMTLPLAGAAALMGLGVWLHVSERHDHAHRHEPLEHEHAHDHDEHHQHSHAGPVAGPHSHRHRHAALLHSHPHFPDIHHRHGHG